jgi:replicative DNA helicase
MPKLVRLPHIDTMTHFKDLGLSLPKFEQVLIGVVLNDQTEFPALSRIVTAQDFYDVQHGTIWHVMGELFAKRADINTMSVVDALIALSSQRGQRDAVRFDVDQAVTNQMILQISEAAVSIPANTTPEYVARRVREAAAKRRILAAGENIKDLVLAAEKPLETIIHESNRLLFKATEQDLHTGDTSAQAAYSSLFDQIESAMNNPDSAVLVPSFLRPLDNLIQGFAPGELVIVGGNAGMGKTAGMLTLVFNQLQRGMSVVYFALEMTREEVMSILISMITGIPKEDIRARKLSQTQWSAFVQASNTIQNWKLHIFDKRQYLRLKPTHIRTELYYLRDARQFPFVSVFVDGLWLMDADEDQGDRARDVNEITRTLTDIAAEFAVPVIVAQQYNREARNRSKKRPMLTDLAESAAVERNAQMILCLYRDSYYGLNTPNEFTEWHILKTRNGSANAQGKYAPTVYDVRHSILVNPGGVSE